MLYVFFFFLRCYLRSHVSQNVSRAQRGLGRDRSHYGQGLRSLDFRSVRQVIDVSYVSAHRLSVQIDLAFTFNSRVFRASPQRFAFHVSHSQIQIAFVNEHFRIPSAKHVIQSHV